MKKIFIICLMLYGCASPVPVQRHFPEVPPQLLEECPSLQTVPDGTTKLSTVLSVVTDNYAEYTKCKIKVETWATWYTEQKKLFEGIK